MKILLPDTVELSPSLPDNSVAAVYKADKPIPDEHFDAGALVAWGNTAHNLADAASRLSDLRWVQTLGAGADPVLRAGFRDDVVITSGAGLHDPTVTEHALTLALALLRRLPAAARAQHERRWASELGGVQPLRPEGAVTSLIGAHVLIWGLGNIGRRLAPVLTALGATVRGVARSAGTRDGFPVLTEDDLETELGTTDVLIMILPATDATAGALSADRLAALPRHAYVVNVGRGTTVDEEALVEALMSGDIAGAALDVTALEPLPRSSPLWQTPNVIITPHAAGGRPTGADELISVNFSALLLGRPMRNVVAR